MGNVLETLSETKMSEKEILEFFSILNNNKSSDRECICAGAHYN